MYSVLHVSYTQDQRILKYSVNYTRELMKKKLLPNCDNKVYQPHNTLSTQKLLSLFHNYSNNLS